MLLEGEKIEKKRMSCLSWMFLTNKRWSVTLPALSSNQVEVTPESRVHCAAYDQMLKLYSDADGSLRHFLYTPANFEESGRKVPAETKASRRSVRPDRLEVGLIPRCSGWWGCSIKRSAVAIAPIGPASSLLPSLLLDKV
ncbi:hypothetical protein HYDPIDRAFT_117211 [Hydnomerulius pinastri MD-312]|uniref:Uncharacterized protein n=1 Tax=Hydnomerulius pinastri MD-312 TaxID=994086 RepID=A0A0C9WAR3_9AGAM|nr:hypothetical protein HYDPIDRAFT_117211 [Hydnomerulius pinastri MD-312]